MIPAPPELLIIAAFVVLLFGASRIPKAANAVGRSTKEFQRGRSEIEAELEDDPS